MPEVVCGAGVAEDGDTDVVPVVVGAEVFAHALVVISFIFFKLVVNTYPVPFVAPQGVRMSFAYFSCHVTTTSNSALE